MNAKITAEFKVTNWDEKPFDEGVGVAKLTQATVTREYTGGIEGTSTTVWLMAYAPDKSARFVGLERIKGTVDGRRGTIVVEHVGHYGDGAAKADVTIISGTNELKGARGKGTFKADPEGSISLALRFVDD